MVNCKTCGGPVTESYEKPSLEYIGGSTATGRRILAGLCWVCQRLKNALEKEAGSASSQCSEG